MLVLIWYRSNDAVARVVHGWMSCGPWQEARCLLNSHCSLCETAQEMQRDGGELSGTQPSSHHHTCPWAGCSEHVLSNSVLHPSCSCSNSLLNAGEAGQLRVVRQGAPCWPEPVLHLLRLLLLVSV